MTGSHDDVSQIQKRYSLTLINPSSFYISLILSVIVACVIVAVSAIVYGISDNMALGMGIVVAVLLATQRIDSLFIRNHEYSKSLHMSFFGNALWLTAIACGIGAYYILSKPSFDIFYVTFGMFLFASFRVGIYTTTLGSSLPKAWLICMLQPLAMFLAFVPVDMWVPALTDPTTLAFGFAFLAISSVWSLWTDRAGLPSVKSTHRLVQAYLFSMSKNDPSEIESIIDEIARPSRVSTVQVRLCPDRTAPDFSIVLPDIHPGPFHPVGGSNIPYLIYRNLQSSAMIMHSVSDHSLNLPSKTEVDNYLSSISQSDVVRTGQECTEPVTVQINRARAVGILFDRTALLFLSLSPYGMEDIPLHVKTEIEQFSANRNFERTLVVDCHNAMGAEISEGDSQDLLTAAKSVLDTLKSKPAYPIQFGYANSSGMSLDAKDLAMGGIGVLCMQINGRSYFLGWADANNMENGVREQVVRHFADNGYDLLEMCTSDTHYTTSSVRNRNGYYQFGIVSEPADVANWFLDIAKKAKKTVGPATFEILQKHSDVKVMGPTIYRDYSRAINRSMKITKSVLIGCTGLFLLAMFL